MPPFPSGVLRGFRPTVRALGGDPDALAVQAGLPATALDERHSPIALPAVVALLELAAETLRRPDLGLMMAEQAGTALPEPPPESLRPMRTVADTLGQAARRSSADDTPLLSIANDPDGARRVVAVRLDERWGASPVAADLALMWLHRGIRHLSGGDYGPRSVELTRAPVADPQRYVEAFGAKVRFGRPVAALRLPAGVLSGGVGHGTAGHAVQERSETAWRVRYTLMDRLGPDATGLADVARTLAVHPRTLQRTLVEEGLTFGEILDCVRRERAREYLTTTGLPLSRIAELLGFADQAVLSRCARRWWGTSPSRLRTG